MKLSIVIPCYNEAENIPIILKALKNAIKRDDIEVILVDNNSTDNTKSVLEKTLPSFSFARSVKEEKKGYGSAILAGLREARGEYFGWTHADLQTDPRDVILALKIIEETSDKDIYVKGKRKNRPFFDQILTFGMTIFEFLYLGYFIPDINGQPNVFPKGFFESWKNPPGDFALDLYAFCKAKKNGISIIRFGVGFPKRLYGKSSWNTGIRSKWKLIKRTITFSASLKKSILPDDS